MEECLSKKIRARKRGCIKLDHRSLYTVCFIVVCCALLQCYVSWFPSIETQQGAAQEAEILWAALWTLAGEGVVFFVAVTWAVITHIQRTRVEYRRGERADQGEGDKELGSTGNLSSTGYVLALIFIGAIILRVSWWFSPPVSSEDVWRYLWDGGLQWLGAPIYTYSPVATQLDTYAMLSPELSMIRPKIGHSEISTIYPQGAQLLFRLATSTGVSLIKMRAFLLLADLSLMWGIVRWLQHLDRSPVWVMLYALCPLAAFEVGLGAHLDVLGICCMIWGLYWASAHKWGRAAVALTFGGWIKLIPWIMLGVIWRYNQQTSSTQSNQSSKVSPKVWIVIGIIWTTILCLAPFWAEMMNEAEHLDGLYAYSSRWRFNDGLFALIHYIFYVLTEFLMSSAGSSYPFDESSQIWSSMIGERSRPELILLITKLSVGVGLLLVWTRLYLTKLNLTSTPIYFILSLFLVSPVMFSWYLLWPLALTPIALSTAISSPSPHTLQPRLLSPVIPWCSVVILWVTLSPLTYLPRLYFLRGVGWKIDLWWIVLEYSLLWLTLGLITRYTDHYSHI